MTAKRSLEGFVIALLHRAYLCLAAGVQSADHLICRLAADLAGAQTVEDIVAGHLVAADAIPDPRHDHRIIGTLGLIFERVLALNMLPHAVDHPLAKVRAHGGCRLVGAPHHLHVGEIARRDRGIPRSWCSDGRIGRTRPSDMPQHSGHISRSRYPVAVLLILDPRCRTVRWRDIAGTGEVGDRNAGWIVPVFLRQVRYDTLPDGGIVR